MAVVATRCTWAPTGFPRRGRLVAIAWLVLLLGSLDSVYGAALPAEVTEGAYSVYSGGDVDVNSPAILVRRTLGQSWSFSGSYSADIVSSASIDVVTTASPYSDRRDRLAATADYLINETRISATGIVASEKDYDARHLDVNLWQDVYGGTGTVHLGFGRGWDEKARVDTDYKGDVDRHFYRLGVRQLITPVWIGQFDYEGIIDHGALENPYRSARVLGASVPERYPGTRNSHAFYFQGMRRISQILALQLGYRFYRDTWDVDAHTLEATLNQRLSERWLAQWRIQTYNQSEASFYSDNFSAELNYMSRDKDLSRFTSYALGAKITYDVLKSGSQRNVNKGTVTLSYDYFNYDYDNFTDVRSGELYGFDAHLFQLSFALWY